MSESRPSWETLNAFVDGELSQKQEKKIEEWVLRDEYVAQEVAHLRHAKSLLASISSSFDTRTIRMNSPSVTTPLSSYPSWFLRFGSIAASIFVVVFIWQLMVFQSVPKVIADAQQAHQHWLEKGVPKTPINTYEIVNTGLTSSGMFIPNLKPVNLQAANVELVTINGREGVHIGYRGREGCLVSLVSWPVEHSLLAPMTDFGEEGEHVYSWQVDNWRYIMLASRMPETRRLLIANVLRNMTLDKRSPSLFEQEQLHASRRLNPPCTA